MAVYATHTDQELVSLLKAGNTSAFEELFERYHPLLYIYAYKRLADREEAKDVTHDLFAALWERREALQVQEQFLPYLYTVLRNKIFDIYKHKKVTERYLDTFQEYLDIAPEKSDYLVRHNELSALIAREIAALPEKMRIVFELSRNTHMSRTEIAVELDISEETVKSRMHAALKILKTKLGPKSFFIFF